MFSLVEGQSKHNVALMDGRVIGVKRVDGNVVSQITGHKVIPRISEEKAVASVTYICAASGFGKSTLCGQMAMEFKKRNKNKDIYLFSRTDYRDDKAFRKLKPIQIPLDDELVENPIGLHLVPNGSLLIFDDCLKLQSKLVQEALLKFLYDILEHSRKYSIKVIITSHDILPNNRELKTIIHNELTQLVVFPSAKVQRIMYVLKQYFGFTKKQIEEVLLLGKTSRWVAITALHPLVLITPTSVRIQS